MFGGRLDDLLVRLVLDGVLEVEADGEFVSGPHAQRVLNLDPGQGGRGPLAALSIEAVRYGEALGDLSVPELTDRLYGFGHRPPTLRQRRSYRGAGAEDHPWLSSHPVQSALERSWSVASVSPHWIMWRPRTNTTDGGQGTFKLYVSPASDDLADAFAAAAEVLGDGTGVKGFKVGRGLAGLNRPDKLVAYFSRLDDLQAGATRLRTRLEGCAVHGVPFTAEVTPNGLLSWGADRPRRSGARGQGSWRFWISSRLALHLDTARKAPGSGSLSDFALARLRLEGVDTNAWAPTREFWATIEARA